MDDVVKASPPGSLWHLRSAQAAWIIGVWSLVLMVTSVFAHPTPFYSVETDLVGEYLPAARELMRGLIDPARFAYKGPGYPMLVGWLSMPLGGDVALAARVLSPLAAGLAAGFSFLIARSLLGARLATLGLLALLVSPWLPRYAIEAGTDVPAMAIMLASTYCILEHGTFRMTAIAGFLAGFAILTRTSAIFLVPCAFLVLLRGSGRIPKLVAYAVGLLVPLALWAWVAARAGGLPPDRNYLNVAWELYGDGVPWDRFETSMGVHFHSMSQVLAYDPPRAAIRIARNLFVHTFLDVRDLLPLWLGVLSLPGIALLLRRRASWPLLMHGVACAAVLSPVFYGIRFGLYLLPIYCLGLAASFDWAMDQIAGKVSAHSTAIAAQRGIAGLALVVLILTGVTTVTGMIRDLAMAPHEARIGGLALARMGLRGRALCARKPHAAYFAGMTFVPFPTDVPLWRLSSRATEAGAQYLFFSNIEQIMRPGDAVLADSGVALPGFEQIAWQGLPHERFFAVYRLTEGSPDSTQFAALYKVALLGFEARHANSSATSLLVAVQLIGLGEPRAALNRLDRLVRLGARNPAVETYRSVALRDLGDDEGAATACLRAMSLARPTAWHWAQLGQIRARQGRMQEAESCFEKAVQLQPLDVHDLVLLGRAKVAMKHYPEAAAIFERSVKLAPTDLEARRLAMGAWALAGNQARVRELLAEGVARGMSASELWGGPSSTVPPTSAH